MNTWKRLLIITVLTLAIYFLSALTFRSFGQCNPSVYQFGHELNKPHQPYQTINGVVLNKYTRNGNLWLTFVNNNTTYKIKVVDRFAIGEIKEGQRLTLNRCLPISSNDWKKN